MFCAKCGTQLPDGAAECPNCHAKVEREINFSDVTKFAGQQMQNAGRQAQKASETVTAKIKEKDEQLKAERKIKEVSDIFVDPSEQVIMMLRGGYLENLIKEGQLAKGVCVLTDRRLYYRGKCFTRFGRGFSRIDEEQTVDLQDISCSGFIFLRNLFMKILMILSAVFMVLMFCCGLAAYEYDAEFFYFMALCGLIGCAVFGFLYWLSKRTMYEISFAGGSLAIKLSIGEIREARSFDKKLRMAKDMFLRKNQ